MTGVPFPKRRRRRAAVIVRIATVPEFKAGDLPPEGYMGWHEWARVQHEAGLRQKQCVRCGLWFYPQENERHKTCKVRA